MKECVTKYGNAKNKKGAKETKNVKNLQCQSIDETKLGVLDIQTNKQTPSYIIKHEINSNKSKIVTNKL